MKAETRRELRHFLDRQFLDQHVLDRHFLDRQFPVLLVLAGLAGRTVPIVVVQELTVQEASCSQLGTHTQ